MNIPYVFKRCSRCGSWKVVSTKNFYKIERGKFKLDSWCKDCKREYGKYYTAKNKITSKREAKNRCLTDEERRKLIRRILFKLTGINYEENERCELVKSSEVIEKEDK